MGAVKTEEARKPSAVTSRRVSTNTRQRAVTLLCATAEGDALALVEGLPRDRASRLAKFEPFLESNTWCINDDDSAKLFGALLWAVLQVGVGMTAGEAPWQLHELLVAHFIGAFVTSRRVSKRPRWRRKSPGA